MRHNVLNARKDAEKRKFSVPGDLGTVCASDSCIVRMRHNVIDDRNVAKRIFGTVCVRQMLIAHAS
jgi:hypothetical protein